MKALLSKKVEQMFNKPKNINKLMKYINKLNKNNTKVKTNINGKKGILIEIK
jgi:hypothetical protein